MYKGQVVVKALAYSAFYDPNQYLIVGKPLYEKQRKLAVGVKVNEQLGFMISTLANIHKGAFRRIRLRMRAQENTFQLFLHKVSSISSIKFHFQGSKSSAKGGPDTFAVFQATCEAIFDTMLCLW